MAARHSFITLRSRASRVRSRGPRRSAEVEGAVALCKRPVSSRTTPRIDVSLEAARDVVQEAFSRTWLYLAEGKKIDYIRAFLYRVAGNLIIDASRKKKSSSLDKMMEDDGYEVADENAKDPSIVPQTREVMHHLKSLDEIYRIAITKRFFEEKSPKEIAAELGVSENVVSVRIHRGIERLGRLMRRNPANIAS